MSNPKFPMIDYDFDKAHIWHPYTSMTKALPTYGVIGASGCELELDTGQRVIDGTSSWWACVHGYGHPYILDKMEHQLRQLSHVMFGGITHQPAIELSKRLIDMTCPRLSKVFLADSGSIAVEVALKMALQYWQGKQQPAKQKILTVKQGYHGDTFAAMSVCDPDGGMHTMFGQAVTPQLFVPSPQTPFGEPLRTEDIIALQQALAEHHEQIAAVIIEPILQGAGGMRFYSADYLTELRRLCDQYDVLLIVDEIATGFGRTGKLFAYEHANIEPDLICVGKALTGGYISLAATLCSDEVAQGISDSPSGVFMHGPTFMGNPLACAAACASLDLIAKNQWPTQVAAIEYQLQQELQAAAQYASVKAVRVLGAIGVLEMHATVNTSALQQQFIDLGVWIRPFANYIYIMPPFTISSTQLTKLTTAMKTVAQSLQATDDTPKFISHG
ncbi:adenosylmethionine--8-amino-7-oxononanoate transaminase [Shewanella gelidii]|uniref:Adenosylmethionine-8-amino-7-oxononanoate aminotransferase n=1 Tax=Shewanella gelidii TaxID=1642821 RepID=A0A917NBG6_9GAMM|nr:adenosylmethionine--8-amino-7-oxononanoate transaminase [Shewanella gelidii]MCL1098329.1 adenosylmethionine--8-amino-7-oxononanoate transaminase [Shewanella gelidii]GGI84426.1 adenosylmethionine--8-amino-7-oxononanoate aminotransferase BioA [Shewanella gelidii]